MVKKKVLLRPRVPYTLGTYSSVLEYYLTATFALCAFLPRKQLNPANFHNSNVHKKMKLRSSLLPQRYWWCLQFSFV